MSPSLSLANATVPATTAASVTLRLNVYPVYFGIILGYFLGGILVMESVHYFRTYKRDNWKLRLFVCILLAVEVVSTGVSTYNSAEVLMVRWGDPTVALRPPITMASLAMFNGIVACMVELYFIWRVWTLSSLAWVRAICGVVFLISIMACISAILVHVFFVQINLNPEADVTQAVFLQLNKVIEIWLIGSVVADVMIVAAMLYTLQQARAQTYFVETKDLLSKLSRQTVQTGLLATIVACLELGFYLGVHEGDLHTGPAFVLDKMYIISLLANLNARRKNKNWGVDYNSSTSTQNRSQIKWAAPHRSANPLSATNIHISSEVEHFSEDHNKSTVSGRTAVEGEYLQPHGRETYHLNTLEVDKYTHDAKVYA